jgi:hypothetical protein
MTFVLTLAPTLAAAAAVPAPPRTAPPPASVAPALPPSTLEVAPLTGQPNLLALGVPEVPSALAARLGQYEDARAARLLDVAPGGEALLVATRFASTAQLHLVTRPLGLAEYGDERVAEVRAVQERISPLNHLEKLRAPLFESRDTMTAAVALFLERQLRGAGGAR